MIVNTERAQGFEGIKQMPNLDALPADSDGDFIRPFTAMQDQSKSGQQKQDRQQKIFHQDSEENQHRAAETDDPEPILVLFMVFVFQCFPDKLHHSILYQILFLFLKLRLVNFSLGVSLPQNFKRGSAGWRGSFITAARLT